MNLTGLDENPVAIDERKLGALRAQLRFPPLTKDDAGFDESSRLWNGMITARPGLVARPGGNAEVMACVGFAREHGLLLSIKGGGHNIAGLAVADGGFMLDLCRMRGVFVDPKARTVRAQAGCLLADIDRETQIHGLATVLGFVSETGVAGLTLGGGFGYLTRQFGWTTDNLIDVEIVTADGRLLRASQQENADLFWALRGGGGNFGVVTSFQFRLHEVGPKIMGGMIVWDGAEAADVLSLYNEVTSKSSRELTLAATVRRAPPAPFLPVEWHGKPVVAMIACHSGPLGRAAKELSAIKGFRKPIADLIVEKPYIEQQRMLDPTQPKGMHYYWKSEYLASLPSELLDVAVERASLNVSPMSQLILFQLEGALSERSGDDGAVGNRDAQFVTNIAGMWAPEDPKGPAYKDWVRQTWSAIQPFSTGGAYINFQTADEGEDRVQAAYGKNLERLKAVKNTYDPANLFRVNRNISPRKQP